MRLLGILASLCSVFFLGGCRQPEGPEAAYRDFAAAARGDDAAKVYGLLSERSRAAFDERARALGARFPGVDSNGRDLVVGDLSSGAARLSKVVVLRESPDAAVLGVTVEGSERAQQVKMVREGGQWRVVVPDTP